MTATDELRRMLDEEGVEYETYIEQPTGFEHVKWSFGKHGNADFNLEFGEPWLTMYGTISGPAQAIAATLGRGTCYAYETEPMSCSCNDVQLHNGKWVTGLSLTVHVMKCSACGGTYEYVNGGYEYCPRCGAKVVSE